MSTYHSSSENSTIHNCVCDISDVISALQCAEADPSTGVNPAGLIRICLKQLIRNVRELDGERLCLHNESSSTTFAASSTPLDPHYYPEPETIGDRIRTLREECELSRMYLADIIDVPRSLMWKWEDDEICPSDEQLARLAEELGCDPHWLRTGEGSPIPSENNQTDSACEPETIGDRIKSMRMLREFGWSDLASSVGVTRSCIEAWEENTTIPASDKIIPLASALNCDPMWLLTGQDNAGQPGDA